MHVYVYLLLMFNSEAFPRDPSSIVISSTEGISTNEMAVVLGKVLLPKTV